MNQMISEITKQMSQKNGDLKVLEKEKEIDKLAEKKKFIKAVEEYIGLDDLKKRDIDQKDEHETKTGVDDVAINFRFYIFPCFLFNYHWS